MAPSPPEHATSAVDQAYYAFDESSITLQEMVEAKLSAGSINRQTHSALDRSMGIVPFTHCVQGPPSLRLLARPKHNCGKICVAPVQMWASEATQTEPDMYIAMHHYAELHTATQNYMELHIDCIEAKSRKALNAVTSSLVDTTRHASKERLYWLRDHCKEGIKAKTFSAPAHSMSQLYKMLETYEAHRELLKAKKPQPAIGSKVGKKVIKTPATVETSLRLHWIMQKLIDLKMDVDQESSSTISLLPAAVINGPAESRAGLALFLLVSTFPRATTSAQASRSEVCEQEAKSKASKSNSSSKNADVIIIDEPVELPFAEVVRKKSAAEEKAEAAKRKKKMEPKVIVTNADPSPSVVIDMPRKRRRHRSSHVYDADQEYEVPSHPTSDVSAGTIKRARDLVASEDFSITNESMHQTATRSLNVSLHLRYHIKHFLSLRKHYMEEIAANKAELDNFHDEMDAE
ncbi:hypothetical protein B0H13DRAFT_2378004 [Mycena leptocephala]|nr:hypothetical protein B0H13DRAFT_2378004 [Mycena leptocephala]